MKINSIINNKKIITNKDNYFSKPPSFAGRIPLKCLPPAAPVFAVIGDPKTLNSSIRIKINLLDSFLNFSHEKAIEKEIKDYLPGAKVKIAYAQSTKSLSYQPKDLIDAINKLKDFIMDKNSDIDNKIESFVMSIGVIVDNNILESIKALLGSKKLSDSDKLNLTESVKENTEIVKALSSLLDYVHGFITPGNFSKIEDAKNKGSLLSLAQGAKGKVHTVGATGLDGGIAGINDKTGGSFVSGLSEVDRFQRGVFDIVPVIDETNKIVKGFRFDFNKPNKVDFNVSAITGLEFVGQKLNKCTLSDNEFLITLENEIDKLTSRFSKFLDTEKFTQLKENFKFTTLPNSLTNFNGLIRMETYLKALSKSGVSNLDEIREKGDLVNPKKMLFFRLLDNDTVYLSQNHTIQTEKLVGTSFAAPLAAVEEFKRENKWWSEWAKSPFFKEQ